MTPNNAGKNKNTSSIVHSKCWDCFGHKVKSANVNTLPTTAVFLGTELSLTVWEKSDVLDHLIETTKLSSFHRVSFRAPNICPELILFVFSAKPIFFGPENVSD